MTGMAAIAFWGSETVFMTLYQSFERYTIRRYVSRQIWHPILPNRWSQGFSRFRKMDRVSGYVRVPFWDRPIQGWSNGVIFNEIPMTRLITWSVWAGVQNKKGPERTFWNVRFGPILFLHKYVSKLVYNMKWTTEWIWVPVKTSD